MGQMLGQLGCRPRQGRQNSYQPERDGTVSAAGSPQWRLSPRSRPRPVASGVEETVCPCRGLGGWKGERGMACEDVQRPGGGKGMAYGERTHRGRPAGSCDQTRGAGEPRKGQKGGDMTTLAADGGGTTAGNRGSCSGHGKREGGALETEWETRTSPGRNAHPCAEGGADTHSSAAHTGPDWTPPVPSDERTATGRAGPEEPTA